MYFLNLGSERVEASQLEGLQPRIAIQPTKTALASKTTKERRVIGTQ